MTAATWGGTVATWGDATLDLDSPARERREAVADAARTVLPSGFSVYASPPEIVTFPAVVVAPRAPYRELLTFTRESVRIAVLVIVPRAAGPDALDLVDATLDLVKPAVASVEAVTEVGDVSSVVLASYGGTDCIVASIDLTVS